MTEFEALLKKSVLGVGEAYRAAEKDLHEEAASASESVEKVTGTIARLVLEEIRQDSDGKTFCLRLEGAQSIHEIAWFFVSGTGYPIKVAGSDYRLRSGHYETICDTRKEIQEYLKEAASSPNSRLVLRIAFVLREMEAAEEKYLG